MAAKLWHELKFQMFKLFDHILLINLHVCMSKIQYNCVSISNLYSILIISFVWLIATVVDKPAITESRSTSLCSRESQYNIIIYVNFCFVCWKTKLYLEIFYFIYISFNCVIVISGDIITHQKVTW